MIIDLELFLVRRISYTIITTRDLCRVITNWVNTLFKAITNQADNIL